MQTNDIDRLKALIADAQSQGIERLPPEPKLSVQLAITRGRLRTLLKKVEDEGLIWRHVGRGTFIGQREKSRKTVYPSDAISIGQVIEARLALEPQLAALASVHATAGELLEMEKCLSTMGMVAGFDEWKRLDDELHYKVALASHNALLIQLYETLKEQIVRHLHQRLAAIFGPHSMSESRKQTEIEHLSFVEAIKNHDPEQAERMMREHIQSIRGRLFGGR